MALLLAGSSFTAFTADTKAITADSTKTIIMTTLQTKVSFQSPASNNDGSAITLPLSYTVFIDTVNPPVKSFAVPAANVSAAVGGLITATFAQLGFSPVAGTDYFASVQCSDTAGTSVMSADISFSYGVVPNAPTGFSVS